MTNHEQKGIVVSGNCVVKITLDLESPEKLRFRNDAKPPVMEVLVTGERGASVRNHH